VISKVVLAGKLWWLVPKSTLNRKQRLDLSIHKYGHLGIK